MPDETEISGGRRPPVVGSARVTPPAQPPAPPPGGNVYGGQPGPSIARPPAAGKASVPGTPSAARPSAAAPPPFAARPSAAMPASAAAPPPFALPPSAAAPPPFAAPGAAPPARSKPGSRKRLLLAVVLPAVLLVALLTTGVAVQLNRELPAATLTTTVPTTLSIPGTAPTMPWPKSGSAELMIEGLGRIGGSGDDTPEAIGSVAKVMTAYLILKNHPLSGDEPGPTLTVTAADVADYQARIPGGQSLVAVAAGEKITERQALEALLIPSANNVAHMLGGWDAGSADAFVTKMNDAAQELGMKNTHYTDPSGFLPTTVSTAADQVLLGRAAIKNPVLADIVDRKSVTIPVAGLVRNHNTLLGEQGVVGIKTGSTGEAGGNLLFAVHLRVGSTTLTLVGAVFNQPGTNTPTQLAQVNKVVRKLLTAVRAAVKEYTLLPDQPSGRITTAWGSTATVSPASPLKVVGWPGLSFKVNTTRETPTAEVTSGQRVAKIQAGSVRVDLVTDAATTPPGLWWKLTRRP